MRWNVFKKRASGRKRNNLKAYEYKFLTQYSEDEPKTILNKEAKRSLAVVASIRDEGIDERNKLKAANSLLDRVIPRVEKHEIEGSLTLESRLAEALEKAGDETKGTKEC